MLSIRSRVRAAIYVGLLYLIGGSIATAGTLLPPGEQTFFDQNGQVLSAGCIYFYVPGTFTPKSTFQNAAQTVANTNPVQLDAAGRAIIYGTGVYRQVVDAAGPSTSTPCSPAGVQIWDQITTDTSSSITIYAGASSGTPNAITVNAPAFSGTDGQVINYISTNTNTGGATINPSGFGAVLIVRDSATGPNPLTGGELVATNAVSLIYDATAGTFHILSPVTWPNSSGVPVGSVLPVGGFVAPTNYAFAYGQAVSRTTFSGLFAAFTSVQSASLSSGSATITGLSDTTQFAKGQVIEAVGISPSTTITFCTATSCVLSASATTTRTGNVTVFAYGDGDGSTTFNLPDYRGRSLIGRDNMGGAAGNVSQVTTTLTTVSSSSTATVASAAGLAIGMSISGNVNLPPGVTISAISGTTITMSQPAANSQSNVSTRFSIFPDAQGLGIAGGAAVGTLVTANLPPYTPSGNFTFTNIGNGGIGAGQATVTNISASGGSNSVTPVFVPQGGTSVPASIISPSSIVNWAVRLVP